MKKEVDRRVREPLKMLRIDASFSLFLIVLPLPTVPGGTAKRTARMARALVKDSQIILFR